MGIESGTQVITVSGAGIEPTVARLMRPASYRYLHPEWTLRNRTASADFPHGVLVSVEPDNALENVIIAPRSDAIRSVSNVPQY